MQCLPFYKHNNDHGDNEEITNGDGKGQEKANIERDGDRECEGTRSWGELRVRERETGKTAVRMIGARDRDEEGWEHKR